MIKRFQVKNYKSLRGVDVSLGRLAVIIGPNAAGKSNLFDAISLLSRIVTRRNLKEAFEDHRGFPLESINYYSGSLGDLQKKEAHQIAFAVDIELSESVIGDVESRIKDLRQGIDHPSSPEKPKVRISEKYLRYDLELEISSKSGQMRIMNERLAALRQDGQEKSRNAFIEKVPYGLAARQDEDTDPRRLKGAKLSLRMEGQAHPTMHDIGLDYAIASTALYAPHYPHLTAFREELARCRFYYFEPRELMRAANAIADVTEIRSRGEDLAAFYYTLSIRHPKQFEALKLAARRLLPRLKDIEIERTDKGELYLRIWEGGASYSNRLLSEGTLRVLGLLAALSPTTGSSTIGYEEPENGVHPRRLSLIADLIRNAAIGDRQILINTHSPVLPSYFDSSELMVCQREGSDTVFTPFSTEGDLFKKGDIERHLEDRILRGDFGG